MAPETAEVMETRRSEASTERYITLCATGKRPVPGVDPGHRPSLSRGTSNWKPSGKLPWELEKLTGNLQVVLAVAHSGGEGQPFLGAEHQHRPGAVLGVTHRDGRVRDRDLDACGLAVAVGAFAPCGGRDVGGVHCPSSFAAWRMRFLEAGPSSDEPMMPV